MRALFFLLLAANLALAALITLGGAPGRELHVSEPLNADRIRLVDAPASVSPTAPASTSAAPAACLEWGAFGAGELPRAEAAIAALQLGDRLSTREVEEPIGYWVYVPPSDTRQEVNRKIAELKAQGLSDYFVIQDASSRWKNAISLGVFRTEEAANRHLAELTRKGVKSAVVSRRDNTVKRTLFVVRNPDDALAAKLVELKQAFQESELKATTCEGGG